MKKWIIERYNKGQDKYKCDGFSCIKYNMEILIFGQEFNPSLYDFLFNPKWGFAKAIWDKLKFEDISFKNNEQYAYCFANLHINKLYLFHLQQMVISDDPLKYLEQFKDN